MLIAPSAKQPKDANNLNHFMKTSSPSIPNYLHSRCDEAEASACSEALLRALT